MPTFTTRDGVELAYEDTDPSGTGVPLVMLHGWGQTQAMFRHQLADLAPDRRVVTLDQRGHGRSAKPHHGYRIARLARDVQEFLDHLGVEEADVLGWSMGVSVWWSYLDQFGTDRIRRFVAVDQPAAVAAVPWMSTQEQAGERRDLRRRSARRARRQPGGRGVREGDDGVRARHVQRRHRPRGVGLRRRRAGADPATRGRPAAVRPLRAGLARRPAAHRRAHAGRRL